MCEGRTISEESIYKIEVDEEAAAIVRRIFAMRIRGAKIAEIVRTLNGEGIDTLQNICNGKGCMEHSIPRGNLCGQIIR